MGEKARKRREEKRGSESESESERERERKEIGEGGSRARGASMLTHHVFSSKCGCL